MEARVVNLCPETLGHRKASIKMDRGTTPIDVSQSLSDRKPKTSSPLSDPRFASFSVTRISPPPSLLRNYDSSDVLAKLTT